MAGFAPAKPTTTSRPTTALLIALQGATPVCGLSLGVSSFVPKAHTPFQWGGGAAGAEKRLKLLPSGSKTKGIALRPEELWLSVIQALLSRSESRLQA